MKIVLLVGISFFAPRYRNELLGKVSLKFTPSVEPQAVSCRQFLDTSGHCRPGNAPAH
jgi:hypothetical protein